jgi:uncharacterized protein (TIGR02466 family)
MKRAPISIVEETPWATTLYTVANPVHDQIAEPIKRFIYNYEAEREARIASGVAADLKGGLFESAFDFFQHDDDDAIGTLKEFCAKAVMEVAKHVNSRNWTTDSNFSLEYHESWFHITRQGGYHDFHNHPNCSWCGIYYFDIGDATRENGSNRFFDPRTAAHNHTDYGSAYLDGSSRYDTLPKDGDLLIFPSYLYHSAPPYHGIRDRIVIAFNASIHYDP